jgi:hypothetical protein
LDLSITCDELEVDALVSKCNVSEDRSVSIGVFATTKILAAGVEASDKLWFLEEFPWPESGFTAGRIGNIARYRKGSFVFWKDDVGQNSDFALAEKM